MFALLLLALPLVLTRQKLLVFVALTDRHHALAAVKGSAALPLGTFTEIHPMASELFSFPVALQDGPDQFVFPVDLFPQALRHVVQFLVASAAGTLFPSGFVKHPCGFNASMV